MANDLNLGNFDQLIGQLIYDAVMKNLFNMAQLGGSVYSDIGLYPKNYLEGIGGSDMTGATPSLGKQQLDFAKYQAQAEQAANPRDWIKLAFTRRDKPVPAKLEGLSGMAEGGQVAGEQQKMGNVSIGPTFSTVGEKGLEYALLAPGSIIAPKRHPDEQPSMENALTSIYEQMVRTGMNPQQHSMFMKASKGLVTKQSTQTGVPSAADGTGTWQQQSQALIQQGRYDEAIQLINQANGWASGTVNMVHVLMANQAGDPGFGEALQKQVHNMTTTLPPELASVPFIQEMSQRQTPQYYKGTEMPYGIENKAINAYNPQNYFQMANLMPSEREMVYGYNSAFGIPEDDFAEELSKTAAGYGLVGTGTRAALRPMFK